MNQFPAGHGGGAESEIEQPTGPPVMRSGVGSGDGGRGSDGAPPSGQRGSSSASASGQPPSAHAPTVAPQIVPGWRAAQAAAIAGGGPASVAPQAGAAAEPVGQAAVPSESASASGKPPSAHAPPVAPQIVPGWRAAQAAAIAGRGPASVAPQAGAAAEPVQRAAVVPGFQVAAAALGSGSGGPAAAAAQEPSGRWQGQIDWVELCGSDPYSGNEAGPSPGAAGSHAHACAGGGTVPSGDGTAGTFGTITPSSHLAASSGGSAGGACSGAPPAVSSMAAAPPPPAGGAVASTTALAGDDASHAPRSATEARAMKQRGHGLEGKPNGLPEGFYQSFDQALADVKKWTLNTETGGGAWGVSKGRSRPALASGRSPRGEIRYMKCEFSGPAKEPAAGSVKAVKACGCPWELEWEQAAEGWLLRSGSFHHNHPLKQTEAEVLASASGRRMPEWLEELGNTVKHTLPIASINAVLVDAAQRAGEDVTWNLADVRSKFSVASHEKTLDASNLAQVLEQRSSEGLTSFWDVNEEGQLDRVFYVMSGAIDEWAKCGEYNTLLYDTSHGTNPYGMKLGCFTTVGESGQTVILAVSLLQRETAEMFTWAFEKFGLTFRVPPLVIFTDGDPAMEGAFAANSNSAFKGTHHYFCTYHLSKNLYTNVHPLFVNNKSGWRAVHSEWWRICKESDCRSIDSFETEWRAFNDLVEQNIGTVADERRAKCLAWIARMGAKAKLWAARWTWANLTHGIHSTQRAEAVHSAIKRFLTASTMLTELVAQLDTYNEQSRSNKSQDAVRMALRQAAGHLNQLPVVKSLKDKVTPFAYEVLQAQAAQANQYNVTPSGDAGFYHVSRVPADRDERQRLAMPQDNTEQQGSNAFQCDADFGLQTNDPRDRLTSSRTCSCQFVNSFQLPCRHMLRVCIQECIGEVPIDLVAGKWLQLSHGQQLQKTYKLLCTPIQQAEAGRPAVPDFESLTKNERFNLLMSEYRGVAEIASQDHRRFNLAKCHSHDLGAYLRTDLQGPSPFLGEGGEHSGGRGRGRGGRGRSCGRGGQLVASNTNDPPTVVATMITEEDAVAGPMATVSVVAATVGESSNAAVGPPANPAGARPAGRPPSRRRAPEHGPTSSSKKQRTGY